ncbi:hypothetical protein BC830DRAFT_1175615 [Chytriomyces sp. MP71]|nr:hypothetical protein BC830DRAFT_1175615 [Chytriomyces sp. MP71]
MESLRTPLPTSFRFTDSKANATKLLELMKKTLRARIEIDGEKIPPPQTLPWHQEVPRFLMAETECGNVSRQEAVTLIPPLLLDVQPGHYIVNTGVKIFTRVKETASSYNFQYRVSAEGVATLAAFLTDKRVVTVAKEDVKLLLEKEYPLITEMSIGSKIVSRELRPAASLCGFLRMRMEVAGAFLNFVKS